MSILFSFPIDQNLTKLDPILVKNVKNWLKIVKMVKNGHKLKTIGYQ
jgi:hypothetical protein